MIPFGKPITDDAETAAAIGVITSGIFVHGSRTAQFEADFAALTGAPMAVSVANCTAALHLAHREFAAGRTGEVICPAFSHAATAHAVELSGLTPVFVDCDASGNMTPDAIAAAVTHNTIGLTLVHFNGSPCDMPAIMKIAERHDLYVVEDCAIALGAHVGDTHVGLFGDAGCFSFHPVKQMTTGEGGMIVSRRDLRRTFELARAFGVDRQFNERKMPGLYDVVTLGFNYRMAEIPAAIGIEQLKKLESFQAHRKANYTMLEEALGDVPGISIVGNTTPNSTRAYYAFIFTVDEDAPVTRETLQAGLSAASIGTSIYYPHPIPRLHYYRHKYGHDPAMFPGAGRIADRSLALPIGPHVSPDGCRHIASTLKRLVLDS